MREAAECVNDLKGKTLTKIEVTDNETRVLIHTTEGIYKLDAMADCCSDSWIEHFESPTDLCVFVDFKEIEIAPSHEHKPTAFESHYEECMKYYFYEIVTDKGTYKIEMRNSSNGYYGGWMQYAGLQEPKQ